MSVSQYTPSGSTPHAGTEQSPDSPPGDLMVATLRGVFTLLRPRVGFASLVFLVLTVLATGVLVSVPRRFASNASFVVESTSPGSISSAVAGLIGQLNPGLDAENSPRFYVDLIRTRTVLDYMLRIRPVATCGMTEGLTVLQMLQVKGATPGDSMHAGRELLGQRVTAGYDLRTGVISVSVEAGCPEQARELTSALVAAVNSFNVERRQTRAQQRRAFAEQQARQADDSLRAAEAALAAFLNRNRSLESPLLRLERDRLERRVSARQDLAVSLRREFETARLDAINSTPALTVIDPPIAPVHPSFPKRRVIFVMIVAVATLVGALAALIRAARSELPPLADAETKWLHRQLHGLLRRH